MIYERFSLTWENDSSENTLPFYQPLFFNGSHCLSVRDRNMILRKFYSCHFSKIFFTPWIKIETWPFQYSNWSRVSLSGKYLQRKTSLFEDFPNVEVENKSNLNNVLPMVKELRINFSLSLGTLLFEPNLLGSHEPDRETQRKGEKRIPYEQLFFYIVLLCRNRTMDNADRRGGVEKKMINCFTFDFLFREIHTV